MGDVLERSFNMRLTIDEFRQNSHRWYHLTDATPLGRKVQVAILSSIPEIIGSCSMEAERRFHKTDDTEMRNAEVIKYEAVSLSLKQVISSEACNQSYANNSSEQPPIIRLKQQ